MDIKQLTKRMARRGAAASGLTGQSDPYSDIFFNKILANRHTRIVEGVVARSGAGSYDVEVCVFGPLKYVCNMLVPCNSNTFGYSTSALPVEGTKVLVLIPDISTKKGYILGVLPSYDGSTQPGQPGHQGNPVYAKRSLADDQTGLDYASSYTSVIENSSYVNKMLCNALRPVDMVPGEFAIQNENDCGLYCSMFSASITSGLAYLKASRFDDTVRISCRTFQQYTSLGSVMSYNDNGYIDREEKVSIYQNERLGKEGLSGDAYNVGSEDDKGKTYYVQNKTKEQTAKARIKSFIGFVGNLINKFVLRPDTSKNPLGRSDKPKDTGVQQVNVDGSGTTRIRSAGGIRLERYDRIPVPHRLKEAWDPEGDNSIEPEALKPFTWDDEVKYRSVQLTDAIAWEHGQEYKRFDEHENDFYTPEESDLSTPTDEYDSSVTKSKPVSLSKADKKRCGIFLQTDGSIILRDNWGSEIVMAGGDVTITAAGDIKVVTPQNMALLGKNVAIDAEGGIDVSAKSIIQAADDDFFVRGNGILLESYSEDVVWSNHKSGSDTKATGITLRSKNSGIAMVAKYLHEYGTESVGIVTGEDENERTGKVSISTDSTYIRGNTYIVNEDSMITNSKNQITMYSESILQAVYSSWQVIKNKEAVVPVWGELERDPIPEMSTHAKTNYEVLSEYNWFSPFTFDDIKDRMFSFRSSNQAETTQMVFVQPAWDTTWSYDTSKSKGSYENWEPHEIEDTDVPKEYRKSWPGYSKFDKKEYICLTPQNVSDGISKKRDSLKEESKVEKKKISEFPRSKSS